MRLADNPHPWIFATYSSILLLVDNPTGRVSGPIILKKGTRATPTRLVDKSMSGVPIHGRGQDSTSRVEQIQHLGAHYIFVLVLFIRWKYTLFSILIFLVFPYPSFIHAFGLPHPRVFHFEILHTIKK